MYFESTISTTYTQNFLFFERMVEAILFATKEPVTVSEIANLLPEMISVEMIRTILKELKNHYQGRGIELKNFGDKWAFYTAKDLSGYLIFDKTEKRKLPRSALETLAIIAYHQPVTKAEIESIRGVSLAKNTIDLLMDIGWIKIGRRKETIGRPLTFITSNEFLNHFGLANLKDLPSLKELKETGFLDNSTEV
jgi:segregation and condensation protein B